jgi:hypothetical protein
MAMIRRPAQNDPSFLCSQPLAEVGNFRVHPNAAPLKHLLSQSVGAMAVFSATSGIHRR